MCFSCFFLGLGSLFLCLVAVTVRLIEGSNWGCRMDGLRIFEEGRKEGRRGGEERGEKKRNGGKKSHKHLMSM